VRALDPRLLRRARPVRVLLGVDVAIGVATAACVLLQAILLADALARAFAGAPAAELARDLVLLAVVFALRGALAWSFEVAGRRAAAAALSELRLALVEQRLRRQPAALDRVEAGELGAAAVQGVDGLEAYFARYLPQLVLACVVPVLVLVTVAAVDLGAALVMLLTLPLVPAFMWLIGRYAEQRTRERWQALRLLSAHFLDVLRGLPTLRAFNRGTAQRAAVAAVGERYRRATMETLRVSFLSGSVLELAATLGVALVAVTVGVRLAGGGLELQPALTVLILAPELYLPLRRLGANFHASADGLAVADRLLELLDEPSEDAGAPQRRAPSPASAPIRLEDVSFAYPARPGLVLDGLDLELAPGETVALIGASGSGKSTVVALVLRLAQPTTGRITIGGVDLAACDPAVWRSHIAWLPQRPVLFRGTVAENIRLGDPASSDERVRRAAILAGADSVARALPDGYDTVVGDGGRPLSPGERRRVALARAFLRDAPLVVLDEPTADLDPRSAALVEEAIQRLRVGRTVLLACHRPELAARADRIVAIEHGRAVVAPSEVAA
jgi:ATP-binding cassette, subfamily C, bacterial CydD